MDIDEKMEWVRQLHSQSDYNRTAMMGYGKEPSAAGEDEFNSFPLRMLLAIGLALWMIVCDLSGDSFFGIHSGKCFELIAADYESSITTWVHAASQK